MLNILSCSVFYQLEQNLKSCSIIELCEKGAAAPGTACAAQQEPLHPNAMVSPTQSSLLVLDALFQLQRKQQ
jgi:hypothetical protein